MSVTSSIFFMLGRFQPFTLGHLALVNEMLIKTAETPDSIAYLFVSHKKLKPSHYKKVAKLHEVLAESQDPSDIKRVMKTKDSIMDYPLDIYVNVLKYLDPTSVFNFIKFFSLVNKDKDSSNELIKYYMLDYLSRDKLNKYIVNVYINLDSINTKKFYMHNFKSIYTSLTQEGYKNPRDLKLSKKLYDTFSNRLPVSKKKKYINLFTHLSKSFIYKESSVLIDKNLYTLIMHYVYIRLNENIN